MTYDFVLLFDVEFHFSEVYKGVNYIGLCAKWMNSEGIHVNFASDPMWFTLQ